MAGPKLLNLRLSLRGRPIKTFRFSQETITIGRTPEADIFLDNQGISRDHAKLEMTSRGYYALEDTESANGTFLNDVPIKREFIMNNDVVRIGKFSLWVTYVEDKRGNQEEEKSTSPKAFEGTTVLSTDELQKMMTTSKETDAEPPPMETPKAPPAEVVKGPSRAVLTLVIALTFLLGTAVGVGATWLLVD